VFNKAPPDDYGNRVGELANATELVRGMKDTDSKRSETVAEKDRRHSNTSSRTRILIVDGHSALRHRLMRLLQDESDLGTCVEAENAQQALKAIEGQHIDLAVVDISPAGTTSVKLAEKIRFHYPNLPLLTLSMDSVSPNAERSFSGEASECAINPQATERIVAAINYVQSLLRSRFSGFTVFVKV
jgi:CheY-like chemotaxis protein